MKLHPTTHAPSLCRWNAESIRCRPLTDLIKLAESHGGFIPSMIDSPYVKWAQAQHRAIRVAISRNEQDKIRATWSVRQRRRYLAGPITLVPQIIYL